MQAPYYFLNSVHLQGEKTNRLITDVNIAKFKVELKVH